MLEGKSILRLSIVVPIYNVEQYLERCVESIFNQGMEEMTYEVIMVNDGSTDASLAVAERLVKMHNNIELYSQPNGGLADARNTGLSHVKGRYVMFLDSDDYLLPFTLNNVLEIAERNDLDVCAYQMKVFREDGSSYIGLQQPFSDKSIYTGEYALLHGVIIASACANLYSVDFLNIHGLRFTKGITHEDVDFNNRIYPYAQKVMFTNICVYAYFWNGCSLNRSKDYEKVRKSLLDDVVVAAKMLDFANKGNLSNELKSFYKKRCNSIIASQLMSFVLTRRDIPTGLVKEWLDTASARSVYPMKGKARSTETTIMIPLLNVKCLYLLFVKISRWF